MTGPETSSGPEAGSASDPTEPLHPAVDVAELETARAESDPEPAAAPSPEPAPPDSRPAVAESPARAKLGRERAHAATSWRDKAGVTPLEHTPITFEDPYSTTPTELRYWAEMRQNVLDGARERKDGGATSEELQEFVRNGIIDELMQRMQAEVDAKTNPDTAIGKAKAKAVSWIREHRKTRIALGVGLSLIAVGATAASGGIGGVTIGAIAARAAVSGPGAYVGLKDLQEVAGNSLSHREGARWWQFGRKGRMAAVDQKQVDAMNADQRLQQMTRILAAKARTGRNPEQAASDDKALELLTQKEREEVDARLQEQSETHFGANLLEGAMRVLDRRVTEQLAAERTQLVHDKKVNRRRTFVAGTIAGGLAGYGLVAGIAQDGVTLGHHAAGAAHHAVGHHGGGPHVAGAEHGSHHATASHTGGTEAPAGTADHAAQVTETHPSSFEHYPEVVTDQVDRGDTPYKVALEHLSRIQGWSHFSPADQHEKAMHFANQLGRDGDHWRYTKEAIRASFGFEHGAVPPDHVASAAGHAVLPSYEQVAPAGGGADHVLPNGGVAAPGAHEFAQAAHGEIHPSSFAHYPEITTQPVQWGDSPMAVARAHLSHIQGWNHFSGAEQHAKTMHFANQLNQVGDHWRYTKEAIQASFNFK